MDCDNEEVQATKKIKEKTADEMFEELGYEKEIIKSELSDEVTIMYIKKFVYEYDSKVISFKLKKKIVEIKYSIDIQELKTIYKKCEELKWI